MSILYLSSPIRVNPTMRPTVPMGYTFILSAATLSSIRLAALGVGSADFSGNAFCENTAMRTFCFWNFPRPFHMEWTNATDLARPMVSFRADPGINTRFRIGIKGNSFGTLGYAVLTVLLDILHAQLRVPCQQIQRVHVQSEEMRTQMYAPRSSFVSLATPIHLHDTHEAPLKRTTTAPSNNKMSE